MKPVRTIAIICGTVGVVTSILAGNGLAAIWAFAYTTLAITLD